jgi:hypothetical protein
MVAVTMIAMTTLAATMIAMLLVEWMLGIRPFRQFFGSPRTPTETFGENGSRVFSRIS